jgi:hypothetical protein
MLRTGSSGTTRQRGAIGLPELVTYSLPEYAALALKLATTPGMLVELKARLASNRNTHALFDIDRFRRTLRPPISACASAVGAVMRQRVFAYRC